MLNCKAPRSQINLTGIPARETFQRQLFRLEGVQRFTRDIPLGVWG